MASVQNSFDLLEATNDSKASQGTQGKKKNKNKGAAAPEQKQQQARENGLHSAQGNGGGPRASQGPPASQDTPAVAPIEAWERAARERKTVDSRSALWKEWISNAGEKSKARYEGSSGALMDFKAALLESRALELSIEGSVLAPGGVDALLLARLVGTFLSFEDAVNGPPSLASTLARLSGLLEGETPDTRGAASRAVQGVIATLKANATKRAEPSNSSNSSHHATSTWVNRIASIDKQLQQQQATMQRMAATGSVTREQANVAKAIFKLMEEKFALLQPANLPSASGSKPASAAAKQAMANLADFESLVNSRLQEAALGSRGRGKGSNQQAGSSALSGFKREEALLAQQAEQVSSQIRTLEAQLRSLYSQQAELADKVAQLRQQQADSFDTVGSKNKGKSQAANGGGVLGAPHFQEELEAIKALAEWATPTGVQGAGSEQVATVQASAAAVPLELMAAGQAYLSTALAALADLPQKVTFCRQRLSHAEKLVRLGAKDHEKMQRDAEKLLDDTLKGADDLLHSSTQVLSDMHQRYEAISSCAPQHASTASAALQSAEALMADIRTHHVQLLLGPAQQQPQQAPVHQHQQHSQQRGQVRGKANHLQQPQQAAAAAAVPAAVSPRTPGGPARPPQASDALPAALAVDITPPAQPQPGAAPITPAPVPITAPVVPHDHMHAQPSMPPMFTHPAPPAAPSTPQQPPPAVSPEILAANSGFEPAAPPVPAPMPSSAAATRAAAAAAAARQAPGANARQHPRPASAQPAALAASATAPPRVPTSAVPAPSGGSAFDAADQILAAARMQQQQQQQLGPSKPDANSKQPRRPAAPPPTATAAAPANPNPAPAGPPRSWAKPVPAVVQQPGEGDEPLPPTPAEAARLAALASGGQAASKEAKPQPEHMQPQQAQQPQQGGGSAKGGKKRAPRA